MVGVLPWLIALGELGSRLDLQALGTLFVEFAAVDLVVMQSHVIGLADKEFEVFDRVVKGVAVLVVDNLRWQKLAAEMLGHDVAVFQNQYTADADTAVTIGTCVSALVSVVQRAAKDSPAASLRAVFLTPIMGRTERVPTVGTDWQIGSFHDRILPTCQE